MAAAGDLEAKEACGRCEGHLGWIDEAWACSAGCTYCPDCRDELGGACANCSEMLRRRERRTRPVGRTAKPGGRGAAVGEGPGPAGSPAAEPFK